MGIVSLGFAAADVVGLLWALLYVILVIAVLGACIWAIQTYIAKIPQPVLTVIAIVLLILVAIFLLSGTRVPHP